MATVREIYDMIDGIAPFSTQMGFDNSGFLVGHKDSAVTGVLVALDITEVVVDEAIAHNINVIVSHHPVIFNPIKSMTDDSITGRILLKMAEHGIAGICAHTNLDAAQGGVNDCLAEKINLTDITWLEIDGTDMQGRTYGIGRVGNVHQSGYTPADYALYIKTALGASGVRFCDNGKPVFRVAVGGGSCGSMLKNALDAGCDTFVTGDVKYDVFLEATALGINLMDAGHYATEQVVCPVLAEKIAIAFPHIMVSLSKVHVEVSKTV